MSEKTEAKKAAAAAAAKGNDDTDTKPPETTEPPADAAPTPEPKKPAGKPSGRNVIPAKPPIDKSPKPFSADGSKDIQPVARGEKCVVINPHARCIVLAGVEPIKPGRNTRDTLGVTAAMRSAPARRLGLIVEELGDPETESRTQKIMNIANTYDSNDLAEIAETDKDPDVVAAAKAQIKKLCPPKEDLEKDGASA